MSKILVVDDDPSVLSAFEQMLSEQGHLVRVAVRGEEALELLAKERPDLVIMDIRMPGISGLEAVRRIRALDPRLPVIIMTGYATTDTAIEATKLGAVDYHLKPIDGAEILRTIDTALERSRLMNRRVELDAAAGSGADDLIVGQSKGMRDVYKAIGRVAETDAAVLIRGETGTGKELVARAIYQHSRRAQAPLIVVNCVAIPATLLESEFFGFEKGSFTGADKRRIGKFEQANGGTIFLDEIGDMPLDVQAKLLRVLQEKAIERIGGNETIPVDVRVLAATHRDLEADIVQGRFREDLYHRLKVFTINLPPLRERREDIPRLAAYFVRKYSKELAVEAATVPSDALDVLSAHAWPGNVRELQHCIQRAMILTGGFPIQPEEMRRAIDLATPGAGPARGATESERLRALIQEYLRVHAGENVYNTFLEKSEEMLLDEALRVTNGNQTHAARLLGMARPTLKARMDKYGLGRAKEPDDNRPAP